MANFDWIRQLQQANGGPLPFGNSDNLPWQSYMADQQPMGGLYQTMQDTAGGESAPGPWSDNTPRQGGGQASATSTSGGGNAFGYSYSDPGGGWNPWSLYDGREGSDGSAVDGWYNAAADSAKWQLNGQPENDRNRVWRWTLDALGPNPGGQPPERVKQVFLEQVARLKRDYANTPGMNWAGSAFSGYDRMPGAQGGQGGAPATSGAAKGRGDQPPGSVAINGGGQSTQNGGQPVSGYFPPEQGGPAGAQTSGGDPLNYNLQLQKDKASRVNALLQALGLGSPAAQHSRVGQTLSGFYTGIMDPYLSAKGLAAGGKPGTMPMDNLGGMIGELAGLGNKAGGFGQIRDVAQGGLNAMLGQDVSSLDEGDVQNIVAQFSALRNSGLAPILQQLYGNQLDDSMGQLVNYQDQGLKAGNTAQATTRWLDYLKNNPQSGTYGFLTGR